MLCENDHDVIDVKLWHYVHPLCIQAHTQILGHS